jgi:hypothetical protein
MQREAILELHRSGKIGLNELVELLHSLPEENAMAVDGTVMEDLPLRSTTISDDEPDKEAFIVLGKNANGGKVQISQEQFQLAVRLRKSGMSTGYRDLIEPFDISEHHAKVLNARIRQELGQEA